MIFLGLLSVLLFSVFIFNAYKYIDYRLRDNSIVGYYKEINSNSSLSNISLDLEMDKLLECKDKSEGSTLDNRGRCMRNFYEKYTLENGMKKAFEHINYVQQKYPEFISDCHYISHGIGHAELKNKKGDVAGAFVVVNEDIFFKNVATCGNGYFHGVIEEYSENTKDVIKLVNLLKPVCESVQGKTTYGKADCYHGVGHAALVQMDLELGKALTICDQISGESRYKYECYSGAFMELMQDLPHEDFADVKDGKINFKLCNSLDEKYKLACYYQMPSLFLFYTKRDGDYAKYINFCKQINGDSYRMQCIRMFVNRAFRFQYTDIPKMCLGSTSNKEERLMCTALFADRIAGAVNRDRKSGEYKNISRDICTILSDEEKQECQKVLSEDRLYLYYPKDTM
jgi:hypothetical protein